ncbi:hypothetical protein CRE_29214 [Caenorhabditis remanei]|uniref:Uncharacterized protein n=1 Tax=Caenorhabditis remanei TaxID=31234 RepID=E3NFZ8_CAERE|nr:hypothetical protein CRE_29214 [Caenorhabditis remanei]
MDNVTIMNDYPFYEDAIQHPILAPTFRVDEVDGCSVYFGCDEFYDLVILDPTLNPMVTKFGAYPAEGFCDTRTQKWMVDDGSGSGFKAFSQMNGICVDYRPKNCSCGRFDLLSVPVYNAGGLMFDNEAPVLQLTLKDGVYTNCVIQVGCPKEGRKKFFYFKPGTSGDLEGYEIPLYLSGMPGHPDYNYVNVTCMNALYPYQYLVNGTEYHIGQTVCSTGVVTL